MSTSALVFAMSQSHLEPIEQLALIIIADACAEQFTLTEAIDVLSRYTSIENVIAQSIVDQFVLSSIILPNPRSGRYSVPEFHSQLNGNNQVAPVPRDLSGYVYLLQSPLGAYKIGKTKNPESRYYTFGVLLPFEVEYVCVIKTDLMNDLEKALHKKFASKRINGEWFHLEPAEVDYIKSLVGAA